MEVICILEETILSLKTRKQVEESKNFFVAFFGQRGLDSGTFGMKVKPL